jgi:hypothetical protein
MTRQSLRGPARFASLVAFVAVLGACGDAPTTDKRGYTKAPLENPGVFIEPEPVTEMSELGEPIRPPIVEIETPGASGQ